MAIKGEIDRKQLILNTAGQITVATTAEVSFGLSRTSDAYTEKVNSEMIANNLDKDGNQISQEQLEAAAKEANSLNAEDVEGNLKKVKQCNEAKTKLKQAEYHIKELKKINDSATSSEDQKSLKIAYCIKNKLPIKNTVKDLKSKRIYLHRKIADFTPEKMGSNNMHFLLGNDREGQVAIDLNPPDPEILRRSGVRVILQRKYGKFIYADHTITHDYGNCRKNISNLIPDPYDGLRPQHVNLYPHIHIHDCNDDEK